MPTTRLRFAAPYQAETPWGQALANVSNIMFSGPGPAQIEASRAAAERARLAGEVDQRKLTGMDEAGRHFETAQGFSKYAPGRPRDPNDPHWDTNAASAAEFYRTNPQALAAIYARNGMDIGQASAANVLAGSSESFSDAERSRRYVGSGKALQPFNAFSEAGQRSAEGRETAQKTSVAVSGAVAAHPLEYQAHREREAILRGQEPGSPDRRITARLDSQRSAGEIEEERTARDLGLTPTDMAQFKIAQKVAGQFKSAFGDGINMKEFETKHPELARTYARVTAAVGAAQSSPQVQGQRQKIAASGQADWEVPSELARGQYVPTWRDPGDGQWRKLEADGKVYILRRGGR